MKILGREPALLIGVVNAAIMVAGTLGFGLLTGDQSLLWIGLINAISAAAVAWTTRPLSPGPFAYAIATIIAVAGSYGLNLPPETVTTINAAVVPLLAFLTRAQVSPITTPVTTITEKPTPEAVNKEFGTPDGLVMEPPENG